MARTEARIFSKVWSADEQTDFRQLTFGAQWLYWALLTQPELSMCGVMTEVSRRWATLASGVDVDDIEEWLGELAEGRFIVRDEATYEVCIRSFVRGDGVLRTPNLVVSMARAFEAVHSRTIREAIANEVNREFPEGLAEGLAERFQKGSAQGLLERLPQGFRDAVHTVRTHHPITPSPSHPVAAHRMPEPLEVTASEAVSESGGGVLDAEALLDEATRLLAEDEADRRGNEIGNRAGYVRSRIGAIRKDHEEQWRLLLEAHPSMTARQLVEPPAKPSAIDATQAAQLKRMIDHERRLKGEACETCAGIGMVEDDDGLARPCPSCRPTDARIEAALRGVA